MKILKWIIIVLIALVAAFFIFSASQPNVLVIEKEISIDAKTDLVYNELLSFESWDKWAAYNKIDSNLISNVSGEAGSIGSIYEWESEKPVVGKGKRELVEKKKDQYIKHKIQLDGWSNKSQDEFTIQEKPNSTLLIRRYEGAKTPFYLNFLNIFMEPMVKNSAKKDLENFKKYVESIEAKKVPNPNDLEIRSFEGIKFISITDSCTENNLPKTLSNLYTELSIFLELNDNAKEASAPIAIFHQRNAGKMIVEAAIPFTGEISESGRIKVGSIANTKVIRGKYYGQHKMSAEIYDAIKTYAKAKNIQLKAAPWEVYTAMTSNNNKNTEAYIYYPIKEKE